MEQAVQSLPVYKVRQKFLKLIRQNSVLVISGATGSGKSTQLPKFLYEARGLIHRNKMVGVTQPRRVAAVTVAKRVAQELGRGDLGQVVGYAVRFDNCTGPATKIKYMTDGILLREAMLNPLLTRYSVVFIDEAHERTLHSDILFGLLKGILQKRPDDFKVVIMSATLEMDRFLRYFPGSKSLSIPGRQHPVQIYYPFEPCQDYVEAALTTAVQVNKSSTGLAMLLSLVSV